MRKWMTAAVLLAVALTLGLATGCSKKPAPQTITPAPVERSEPTPAPVVETPRETAPVSTVRLADVFFDYDKSVLRKDAQDVLAANAEYLRANPDVKVLIEGHCDERGTTEYNLALGDRRARAARDFLVNYGIAAARIETISYGEERPFAQGQNEAAWSQNRRAHFAAR